MAIYAITIRGKKQRSSLSEAINATVDGLEGFVVLNDDVAIGGATEAEHD